MLMPPPSQAHGCHAKQACGLPYVAIEAGESVVLGSSGDFMSEDEGVMKNAGVTFWAATGCDSAGHCAWNADRTEGAVVEWNMASGTLYYDLSAVEAMDDFSYTMDSSCFSRPHVCRFSMAACPPAPHARVAAGGVTYCNSPKRVCLIDDLGGSEADPCTTGTPRCTVWGAAGATGKKVFYQEYAQAAACGCFGCHTKSPGGAPSVSSNVTCKTVRQRRMTRTFGFRNSGSGVVF